MWQKPPSDDRAPELRARTSTPDGVREGAEERTTGALTSPLQAVAFQAVPTGGCRRERGAPRLMVRLLIYGCTTGVRPSRAIERKCVDDVAFRFLAADQEPDFRSRSPGSAAATSMRSPACSSSPCTSRRSWAW